MPSETPTRYRVICSLEGRVVYFTKPEWLSQVHNDLETFYCPNCGGPAVYDSGWTFYGFPEWEEEEKRGEERKASER